MEIYQIGQGIMKSVEFEEMAADKQSKYWVIATPDEISEKNHFFNFYKSTIHECKSLRQHPRLEVYDDLSFGVLNIIDKTNHWFVAKELNFFLTRSSVIFVIREKAKIIETIKKEINENLKESPNYTVSGSKIMYSLLDKVTSMDNVILADIENKIAALEEQVMEGVMQNFIEDIIRLRKQLLYLKRYYEPLLDLAEDLEENDNGLIEENAIKYFKILVNRIQRLNNSVLNLRDYITQVREAYQAQVDISLNKIMKVFTVITAIFLPLTLIAGWYGMNFEHMPEFKWTYGYPFVFALSGTVALVSLIIFKKSGFLD